MNFLLLELQVHGIPECCCELNHIYANKWTKHESQTRGCGSSGFPDIQGPLDSRDMSQSPGTGAILFGFSQRCCMTKVQKPSLHYDKLCEFCHRRQPSIAFTCKWNIHDQNRTLEQSQVDHCTTFQRRAAITKESVTGSIPHESQTPRDDRRSQLESLLKNLGSR